MPSFVLTLERTNRARIIFDFKYQFASKHHQNFFYFSQFTVTNVRKTSEKTVVKTIRISEKLQYIAVTQVIRYDNGMAKNNTEKAFFSNLTKIRMTIETI